MSQHPDNEAAEKEAKAQANDLFWIQTPGFPGVVETVLSRAAAERNLRVSFIKGATHVRASLAPELEKLKDALEIAAMLDAGVPFALTRGDFRGACRQFNEERHEAAIKAREALEILSRLMGKR